MHTLSLQHSKRCFLILAVFDPILIHIPTQMKAICRTSSIQMGCQEEGLRIVSAESAIKAMLSSSPMVSNVLNVPKYKSEQRNLEASDDRREKPRPRFLLTLRKQ